MMIVRLLLATTLLLATATTTSRAFQHQDPFRHAHPTSSSSLLLNAASKQQKNLVPIPLGETATTTTTAAAAYDDDDEQFTFITGLMDSLAEDVVWSDYVGMYEPLVGLATVERHLRLYHHDVSYTVEDKVRDPKTTVLLLSSNMTSNNSNHQNNRSMMWLSFNEQGAIHDVRWVREPETKTGELGLKILSVASNFLEKGDIVSSSSAAAVSSPDLTPPEMYFAAWNARDMDQAASLFSDDIVYDDTAFSQPLSDKAMLIDHLNLCANCFPSSFTIRADDVVVCDAEAATIITTTEPRKVAVRWHIDNNGAELPFTRGVSIYTINGQQKIESGIDFIDGTYIKTDPFQRFSEQALSQLSMDPVRLVPAAVWVAYMYIVFLSDGILPGANALVLEQRTWEEVLNLSLNFFFVAPVLHLPFSPTTVHPMLEGVFNLLLSWAAMFSGLFLCDDRRDKPNLFPALPAVIGMQFLTSAFLLPYLVLRTNEDTTTTTTERSQLSPVARVVAESRLLGPAMGFVGASSILWGLFARTTDFGGFPDRYLSFIDLLSIDRVGSSFLVDLVIFGLFQGWLVDDDLKRRGVVDKGDRVTLRRSAAFVPFFGLAAYLLLRPSFPNDEDTV